jgi:hypothetical protein
MVHLGWGRVDPVQCVVGKVLTSPGRFTIM